MKQKEKGVYGLGEESRSWQCVIGCSPKMQCAERCWARRTIARVVECQNMQHPRAEFFRQALTPDLQQWSGRVLLDPKHLEDPLHWRKPALIATAFHGDIARLTPRDKSDIFKVIKCCPQHRFILLTKQPQMICTTWEVLPNVFLGCSVMNQTEADRQRSAMAELVRMGWKTHVWYEPALSAVDWTGWEFTRLIICGGESGEDARPCDVAWIRSTIAWCKAHGVACRVKQLGARPIDSEAGASPVTRENVSALDLQDRKGADPAEWPPDLRVRELPEEMRVGGKRG